jgi:hypothetical protein
LSTFVLHEHIGAFVAYLLMYVDDMVLATSSAALLRDIITKLKSAFTVKDMRPHAYFLGIDVQHNHDGFFLSQNQYVDVGVLYRWQ